MGRQRRTRGRPLDGILLLNKPLGLSSNQALQEVKNIYFAQKAGHTGSLDPLATGMLPICFGEATKFSQFLLEANKEYTVTGKLGIRTTTCDKEGEVIATASAANITAEILETTLKQFTGDIQQIPSMFSALKHKGKPLYKLAREGIEVERQARSITIAHIELLNFSKETSEFSLNVKCSKGTYIRNLIDDIGQALGCGAHVAELHRVVVSGFKTDAMVTLDELNRLRDEKAFTELDDLILPLSYFTEILPSVLLTEAQAFKLQHGEVLDAIELSTQGLVSVVCDGRFIAIGELSDNGQLRVRRSISAKQ
jgi:tRNA pseudouridine55 synthase